MSYLYEGNLDIINQNENRREITKAMEDLSKELDQVRPSDVAKFYGVPSTQKTVEEWLEQCNVWQINSS